MIIYSVEIRIYSQLQPPPIVNHRETATTTTWSHIPELYYFAGPPVNNTNQRASGTSYQCRFNCRRFFLDTSPPASSSSNNSLSLSLSLSLPFCLSLCLSVYLFLSASLSFSLSMWCLNVYSITVVVMIRPQRFIYAKSYQWTGLLVKVYSVSKV